MTPRLAVTQEQAADLIDGFHVLGKEGGTVRLPERPTMPCPECGGSGRRLFMSDVMDCTCGSGYSRGPGVVPIPEGTGVSIEYPCRNCLGVDPSSCLARCDHGWRRVAAATLASVADKGLLGEPPLFVVTLTNLKPMEDQSDG